VSWIKSLTGGFVTAFLLTWKESGWPHENILRMVGQREPVGYVDEPWRN
jgi:hypothetical protein